MPPRGCLDRRGRRVGKEGVVADLRFERKKSLSREEAVTWLTALSRGFTHGGDVELPVGEGSTVAVRFPEEVQAEFEIEVKGDEVEVEFEFKWTLTGP
jgi:amphi-Trp domain-containing protein